MPTPLKPALLGLRDAIAQATSTGQVVPLDIDIPRKLLENLAFLLDCSVSFVELPEGGPLVEGTGACGEFALHLKMPCH